MSIAKHKACMRAPHEKCIWRTAAIGVPGLPNCTKLGCMLTAGRGGVAATAAAFAAAAESSAATAAAAAAAG